MKATRVRLARNETSRNVHHVVLFPTDFCSLASLPLPRNKKIISLVVIRAKIRPDATRSSLKAAFSRPKTCHALSRFQTERKKRRGGAGGRRENYFPGAGERQNDPTPDVEFRQRCLSVGIEFSFLIDWSSSFFFFFFFFIVQNEKLEQSRRSFASYPHALATGSRTITSDRVRFVAFSKNTHTTITMSQILNLYTK